MGGGEGDPGGGTGKTTGEAEEKYLPKRGDLVRVENIDTIGFVLGWENRETFQILVLPRKKEFAVSDGLLVYWDPRFVSVLARKTELIQIDIRLPNPLNLQAEQPQ